MISVLGRLEEKLDALIEKARKEQKRTKLVIYEDMLEDIVTGIVHEASEIGKYEDDTKPAIINGIQKIKDSSIPFLD